MQELFKQIKFKKTQKKITNKQKQKLSSSVNISRLQENQVNQTLLKISGGKRGMEKRQNDLNTPYQSLCSLWLSLCTGFLRKTNLWPMYFCYYWTFPFSVGVFSTMLMLRKVSFSFLIRFTQYINHEMGLFFHHTSLSHLYLQHLSLVYFSCVAVYLQESQVLW